MPRGHLFTDSGTLSKFHACPLRAVPASPFPLVFPFPFPVYFYVRAACLPLHTVCLSCRTFEQASPHAIPVGGQADLTDLKIKKSNE